MKCFSIVPVLQNAPNTIFERMIYLDKLPHFCYIVCTILLTRNKQSYTTYTPILGKFHKQISIPHCMRVCWDYCSVLNSLCSMFAIISMHVSFGLEVDPCLSSPHLSWTLIIQNWKWLIFKSILSIGVRSIKVF